jgi:ABC-2 type transport system permease protein
LGALILSASYLALGVFVSSLTKQQTISFLITFAILFVNDIFSQDYFLLRLPLSFRDIISSLSLTPYYQNIVNGLLTLKGIVFVMTWIITFIILSYFHLKSRKDSR